MTTWSKAFLARSVSGSITRAGFHLAPVTTRLR
jgi:hypothetical protein